jgi:hypothetical protein
LQAIFEGVHNPFDWLGTQWHVSLG